MSKTKGIAIRVPVRILQQIENHELSRNELVNEAIVEYFNKDQSEKKEESTADLISDDVYDEAFSAIYNTEVVPLQKQLEQQEKLISVLQDDIRECREDKRFLKDQILSLQQNATSRFSLFKRKKKNKEIVP